MLLQEKRGRRDELVFVGIEIAIHAAAEEHNENTDKEQKDSAARKRTIVGQ